MLLKCYRHLTLIWRRFDRHLTVLWRTNDGIRQVFDKPLTSMSERKATCHKGRFAKDDFDGHLTSIWPCLDDDLEEAPPRWKILLTCVVSIWHTWRILCPLLIVVLWGALRVWWMGILYTWNLESCNSQIVSNIEPRPHTCCYQSKWRPRVVNYRKDYKA